MKLSIVHMVLASLLAQVLVLNLAEAHDVKKDTVYQLTSRKCSDGSAIINEPWTEAELVGHFTIEFKGTGKFVVTIGRSEVVNSDYRIEGGLLYTIQMPSGKVVESPIEVGENTLRMTSPLPPEQRATYCPNGADATVAEFVGP